jgi:PRD1 phage membrane DNA delivery
MGDKLVTSVVTVATALIGVAIISVLVSKNANTTNVVSSISGAFNTGLGTAISPITGQSFAGGGSGLGSFGSLS